MLGVKDDEIHKQGRQIEELKRQVAASRDEELRIRAQTYWMRKVKDDEIQEKNRLIGELRSHIREKEELVSTTKAKLQSLVPSLSASRLRPSNPRPGQPQSIMRARAPPHYTSSPKPSLKAPPYCPGSSWLRPPSPSSPLL